MTGNTLAPEAGALLEAHGLRAVYAAAYTAPEDLARLARAESVAGIIVRSGNINAEVIGASVALRAIAKHGSGVDNIDLEAASRRGIPVLRAIAANSQSVAEHTLALIFALLKDLFPLDRAVRGGKWPKPGYKGREIAGARFGLVGYGEVGRRVAVLASAAGMDLIAYDPMVPPGGAGEVRLTDDLGELLASSDVVSLHCPLTPQTHHLFDAERLAKMKPTAFLVNTARGAVVEEAALVHALQNGVIAGAALDSFETEPPPADSPLWRLPNVILTPHIAGASVGALREMGVQAAAHVIAAIEGRPLEARAVANPDYRNANVPVAS